MANKMRHNSNMDQRNRIRWARNVSVIVVHCANLCLVRACSFLSSICPLLSLLGHIRVRTNNRTNGQRIKTAHSRFSHDAKAHIAARHRTETTHTHRDRRRLARSLFHNITRYLPNACLRKTHVSNAGVLRLVVTTAPGTTIAYSFLHCDEGSG